MKAGFEALIHLYSRSRVVKSTLTLSALIIFKWVLHKVVDLGPALIAIQHHFVCWVHVYKTSVIFKVLVQYFLSSNLSKSKRYSCGRHKKILYISHNNLQTDSGGCDIFLPKCIPTFQHLRIIKQSMEKIMVVSCVSARISLLLTIALVEP